MPKKIQPAPTKKGAQKGSKAKMSTATTETAKTSNGNGNGTAPLPTEGTTSEHGTLMHVPLNKLDMSLPNVRTGNWTVGGSKEELHGNSFEEIKSSIKAEGQLEPCLGRPGKNGKVQIYAGYRRVKAIQQLAQESGTEKTATVAVWVKDRSDLQVADANLIENSGRDDLQAPDLAWGVYYMQQRHLQAGTKLSDHEVADRIGKNQSYISMLLRIVKNAPKVAKQWQENTVQLSVNTMHKISKLGKDLPVAEREEMQQKEYDKLLKAGSGNGTGAAPGGKNWYDTAITRATNQGTYLGQLEREGLIAVQLSNGQWAKNLEKFGIKLDESCSSEQRKDIGKVAKEAYSAALNAPAPDAQATAAA